MHSYQYVYIYQTSVIIHVHAFPLSPFLSHPQSLTIDQWCLTSQREGQSPWTDMDHTTRQTYERSNWPMANGEQGGRGRHVYNNTTCAYWHCYRVGCEYYSIYASTCIHSHLIRYPYPYWHYIVMVTLLTTGITEAHSEHNNNNREKGESKRE